jgi:uncharacterized delta-60 repeat protein
MKMVGRSWGAAFACFLVGLVWAVGMARGDVIAVQPDGKIVVLGQVWPEAGAVARLDPDGSIDRGFGDRGFVIDHRLPGFRAVGLTPDGRIVGAAVGGFNLARYLPDGTPDPSFARGGIGGTDEPDQEHDLDRGPGPSAMVIRPDGGIVVAGSHPLNDADPGSHPLAEGVSTEKWVRRYDSAGSLLETVGGIATSPGAHLELTDLLEAPDRSLIGAGSTYNYDGRQLVEPILARFVPGSGSAFDPAFGGGAGLVRPDFPRSHYLANNFRAIAADGDGFLAAGRALGTFLLARFDWDGRLDPGFGEGGFVAPPIEGPPRALSEKRRSWAEDLALMPDGDILVGGRTSQWGRRVKDSSGAHCFGCEQPMLARFDAGGHLDPSFGAAGLLRLRRPDGDILKASVGQVVPLPNGKFLVSGSLKEFAKFAFFVARLNGDGSYDRSFGDGGLVTPRFPCRDHPQAFHRFEPGCLPSLRVAMHLRRAHSRHPVLTLRARHSFDWVGINALAVTLPESMRLAPHFEGKVRVAGTPEVGRVRAAVAKPGERGPVLFLEGLGNADEVRLGLGAGAIVVPDPSNQRPRPVFKVWAEFNDARWNIWAGNDRVTRRVG